jgi:hypothetical protein
MPAPTAANARWSATKQSCASGSAAGASPRQREVEDGQTAYDQGQRVTPHGRPTGREVLGCGSQARERRPARRMQMVRECGYIQSKDGSREAPIGGVRSRRWKNAQPEIAIQVGNGTTQNVERCRQTRLERRPDVVQPSAVEMANEPRSFSCECE